MNELLSRYSRLTGDSPEVITRVYVRPSLRVNTLRTSQEQLVRRLSGKGVKLTKVPFLEDAFYYDSSFSLGATEEYLLGLYYLQEAASMLPAAVLHRLSGGLEDKRVLDVAAAPGSKTTQLAALMKNTGLLVALDSDRRRLRSLANNLERCGVTNAYAYVKDGVYAEDLGLLFDAVLLDAPCSGNYCLSSDWLDKRSVADAAQQALLQTKLLRAAYEVLVPGGVLVYSTCSLEPEEDEAVLTSALPEEAMIIDPGLPVGEPGLTRFSGVNYRTDCANARRLWPHRTGTQGFFLAAIKKPA